MGEENHTACKTIPIKPEPHDANVAPIVSSYNERIRPVLDAVENLRRLNITKEGIQLPTIVVVGDQSSGKSSVLESLAGISLPRGQGICTRVPLIMRLQHHPLPNPELVLEYNNQSVSTDEAHVSDAIRIATNVLAGDGKGITNTPLTLLVKKNGVPDLTMVDLPGITRVPVHGQPDDIYDQIVNIIMEYIRPEESIILNVLSATVDFSTCESIRMSQSVDKTGLRTLAVVTKADRAPEGLLEKVTADDVNIGLGYVCVRNRIGDESYEEARVEEARLFRTHPLLSKIDKSIVGVPVLAQKLVQIQATSISRILPEIVKKINDKLSSHLSELEKLPKNLTSPGEAMSAFMHIIGLAKESLRKILLRGEFDEYPDEKNMHCTARLVEMLDQYSNDLHNCQESDANMNFLMEEIKVLEEAKWIGLPNFMPRTAFLTLLHSKVKAISGMPTGFIDKVWDYLEEVVVAVLMHHSEHYHQLQVSTRRAGQNLIAKMKEKSMKHVMEVVEMEKLADYTCNPEYMSEYNKLMAKQGAFLEEVLHGEGNPSWVNLEGFGDVGVAQLRQYPILLPQAFDLKMRLTSYWRIVLKRMIDSTALHLQFRINSLVDKDLGEEIVNEMMSPYGGGIERLLEESPSVASKRERLNRSVAVLRESKGVVANIMDTISSPAPKETSRINVRYDIDVRGILEVPAEDKTVRLKNRITINKKEERWSPEELKRTVRDAEKYKAEDEDEEVKKKVEAKNFLENYAYEMRGKVKKLEKAVEETVERLERNQLAEVEEFEHMKQELEKNMRVDFISNVVPNISDEAKVPIWCTWRFPPNGWVCLNTDGSVFENKHRAACGGLVRDSAGCFLGGFSVKLDATSVTLAELCGVVHGLNLAWDLGCRKVKVDIDSGSALALVRNCPVGSDPAFGLVCEISALVRRDWLVEFSHIFRESNRAADKMAHMGHSLELGLGVKRFTEPPSAIADILRDDVAGVALQRGVPVP